MDLVTEDKEVLEKYFLEKFPDSLVDEEAYHLLLLVLGEKPGVLVMSADKNQRKILENFCKDTGLKMNVVEGKERSLLDRILGRSSMMYNDSIYISRGSERFEILEASEGSFTGFSECAVGEFLGYPDEAIEFYEGEEVPGMKFEESLEELIEKGVLSEDEVELLSLLGYLPAPEKESIQKALKVAESRGKMLHKFDSKLDTSIGETYLHQMSLD